MANIRFPSNADLGGRPFILFNAIRAKYSSNASEVKQTPIGESVALYFPTSYNVSDSLNYQSESTGLAGAGASLFLNERDDPETEITADYIKEVATGALTNKAIAAATAAGLAAKLGVAGMLGAAGVFGNIAAEVSKTTQAALNPREFMLFKSPNIRTFSFNFNFIPSNEEEANNVPKIISFFRKSAYPELTAADTVYNFPNAFNINFNNADQIIKIPQVFCTGVNVTYNPNTISYFKVNNTNVPVEVSLGLTFQELQPIHRGFIDQGY